jgi:hypothetical protein
MKHNLSQVHNTAMLTEFSLGLKTTLGASALGFAEAAGQTNNENRLSERDRYPRIPSATLNGNSKPSVIGPFVIGYISFLKMIDLNILTT